MTDTSHFLIDMNMYLAFKEGMSDIISFHSSPRFEYAQWTVMSTLTRAFDTVLGVLRKLLGHVPGASTSMTRFSPNAT